MVLFSGVITLYATRYDVIVYTRNNDEAYYNIVVDGTATVLYLQNGTWKAGGVPAELAERIGAYLPELPASSSSSAPTPTPAPSQNA